MIFRFRHIQKKTPILPQLQYNNTNNNNDNTNLIDKTALHFFMEILLYISTGKWIYRIPSFVSQYLLCIYLLRERMWVIVLFFTIYIQISIIPNNIMLLFFPFYMKLF